VNSISDRALALLIIIRVLHHRLTYEKIRGSLLAYFVKNTDLKRYYSEERELPPKDPYRAINPWYPEIFREDLPRLESMGMVKRDDSGVKLTEKGHYLGKLLSKDPNYSRFEEQVIQLAKEGRKGGSFSTSRLKSILIRKSKETFSKEEALIYDRTGKKMRVGIVWNLIEPGKIDAYVGDFKEIIKSIVEKIRKKEVYKASSSETQIKFLEKICQQSENLPVTEKPLVEVTGLCVKAKLRYENDIPLTELTLFLEGRSILVVARGWNSELIIEGIEYHGLRIIGVPRMGRVASIQIEAIKIFDRGKRYPVNGRAF
jgi:hypothetical protein